MSEENVEIVRRLIEANRSGPADATTEAAVRFCDPSVEFRSRLTAVEGATYRGHDGIRRYFKDLADAWQEWRNEPDEIVETGADAVLTETAFRGIGRDSGAKIELRIAVLFLVRNGKVLRVYSYATREEALEAAGLSE